MSLFHENFAMLDQFQAAGELTFAGRGYGSATLIAPGWVLTAAHATDGVSVQQLRFRIGGQSYSAEESFEHPLWLGTSRITEGFDIALVRLSSPVAGVQPASVYRGPSIVGQQAVLVGAGLHGNGITGQIPGTTGTLRAGANTIDVTADQLSTFLPGTALSPNGLVIDFDDPRSAALNRTGSGVPLDHEFFPGQGDSGGAYWVEDQRGEWKMASIQSWGTLNFPGDNFGKYGNIAVSAQLNDELTHDWIASLVPAPWASPVLFAGYLVARRRKR